VGVNSVEIDPSSGVGSYASDYLSLMSDTEDTDQAPKRRGRRKKTTTKKPPKISPARALAGDGIYPKGFPTNENGDPGDLGELDDDQIRELGVLDADSARMLQMTRSSTARKAAGENKVPWPSDDDSRFSMARRLWPGCKVKFKQIEPHLDQSFDSRPITAFRDYDEMVHHLKVVRKSGDPVVMEWWIGDGTIPSRTSGRVNFAYDPNFGQGQAQPLQQEELQMSQQNPFGGGPPGGGQWPGYPGQWGQPPGWGAPPNPWGGAPPGWGQSQAPGQPPVFVFPGTMPPAQGQASSPPPPPQQQGQPQQPPPPQIMFMPQMPPQGGGNNEAMAGLFNQMLSMYQGMMTQLTTQKQSTPEAEQLKQAMAQIQQQMQFMYWQMMQPKAEPPKPEPPPAVVPPPVDPMTELRKSMDLFTAMTMMGKKAAAIFNPNPTEAEKAAVAEPRPDDPLVIQDAGPVRFGYERAPDGTMTRLTGMDRALINGDKAQEAVKGFGNFVKDLFKEATTMRREDGERQLKIEQQRTEQLAAAERLERTKVPSQQQPAALSAHPPPPPPPVAPPPAPPPRSVAPPTPPQKKGQGALQMSYLHAMRSGIVKPIDTTGEEQPEAAPTPVAAPSTSVPVAAPAPVPVPVAAPPTPVPTPVAAEQKPENSVGEAPTDPAPPLPPPPAVVADVAPPPTAE
jgi:hypothetical protein